MKLAPCPFCGAGTTDIVENGRVWAGSKWGTPSSVSVRHHCDPTPGQPSRMIERVGRDEESAIAAWNMRSNPRADKLAAQLRIAAAGLKHCAGWNINEDKKNALMAVVIESENLLDAP